MLSKLFKYELKATGRIFLPLLLVLLLFAVINKFTIGPDKFDAPAMISMAIYVFIMAGMFVMTFLMMIQRFHKNLLSDEGYLMLTLPVKPWKHIVSKLFVSMLWMAISGIAALISILIIALKKGDLTQFTVAFVNFYHRSFELLGASVYLLSFEIIMVLLVSLASGILVIYASIAIGHLFNQHKMLASFGAFIVLSALSKTLLALVSSLPGTDYYSNINIHISSIQDLIVARPVIQLVLAAGIIFTGLAGAAYFAITNYILSKRLNLE